MPNKCAMTSKEWNDAREKCRGGAEAHVEHLRINGDCPWCATWDSSKWAPPSDDELGKCDLCGEDITMLDVEHGNIAEMHNPKTPHVCGLVHTTCGQAKEWEVS